jgi:hypothetical protein
MAEMSKGLLVLRLLVTPVGWSLLLRGIAGVLPCRRFQQIPDMWHTPRVGVAFIPSPRGGGMERYDR